MCCPGQGFWGKKHVSPHATCSWHNHTCIRSFPRGEGDFFSGNSGNPDLVLISDPPISEFPNVFFFFFSRPNLLPSWGRGWKRRRGFFSNWAFASGLPRLSLFPHPPGSSSINLSPPAGRARAHSRIFRIFFGPVAPELECLQNVSVANGALQGRHHAAGWQYM
jgi:hypothetical protein